MIGMDGEKMTLTKVTNVGQSIKFGHRMQQSCCCVGNFAFRTKNAQGLQIPNTISLNFFAIHIVTFRQQLKSPQPTTAQEPTQRFNTLPTAILNTHQAANSHPSTGRTANSHDQHKINRCDGILPL